MWWIFPIPPPTGMVQRSSLSAADQLAIIVGAVDRYQPSVAVHDFWSMEQ